MARTPHPVVVVGIDGSEHSHRALVWATAHAKATDSTLRVVAAWDTPHFFGRAVPREGYEPAELAHDLVAKAVTGLDLPADRIECRTPMGPAGEVLVEASVGAETLVIGAHGHNPVYTLLLGSTARHCLHHASTTVVVIP